MINYKNVYRTEVEEMTCDECNKKDIIINNLNSIHSRIKENRGWSPLMIFFAIMGCLAFVIVGYFSLMWQIKFKIFSTIFSLISFIIHFCLGKNNGNY